MPMQSMVAKDCIETGRISYKMPESIRPVLYCDRVADFADSLAAVKKLVFEDKQ